ncbi:MAG TPA: histidine kinase [Clostridiales bacterium]|nr:MAG: hypothetical protein A2Y18_00235 [Clostridiales bacterium GWD2_32_19]HCC06936.1 histidine kinase [Clostridiales bacterium]
MKEIRVLIADDSDKTREIIEKILQYEEGIKVVGQAGNGKEAIAAAERLEPDVILMDINMPIFTGIEATEQIMSRLPDTIIIMMSVQKEADYLKKAMEAGAKNYLLKPFNTEEIINTLQNTYKKEKDKKQQMEKIKEKKDMRSPKSIAVFSAKGGVGKSTTAINTAIAIKKETSKKVIIVDMDVYFGDICTMANVEPSITMIELIEEMAMITTDNIHDYIIETELGVDILAAPKKPEYADYVTVEHAKKIANLLKEDYDYIVFDLDNKFSDLNLAIMDQVDLILYITTMEITSIKNAKLGIDVMKSLNYASEKIKIVANKSDENYGISISDIKKVLERDVDFSIMNNDKIVINSINKGMPIMADSKKSNVTESFRKIAKGIK